MRVLAMKAPDAFNIFETQLIGEVRATIADKTLGDFRDPSRLRAVVRPDATSGARVTEFHGSPLSWMQSFMLPAKAVVGWKDGRGNALRPTTVNLIPPRS